MSGLTALFAEGGALDRAVRGFRVRPFQLEMAQSVAAAIQDHALLVVEAGTGTGKTFAYLAPALLSGGKVIISTGTKNLQDQLFDRDIPTVRAAIGAPVTVALLKGRSNYLCHFYLDRTLADGRLPSRDDARHLPELQRFARVSRTGDKADCPEVPEDAAVWSYVTSTRDNCLGAECRHFDRCFVMQARKQAMEADVVVVNHHLFFADLVLRDEGVGELLPACNTVIFDEAHQLPETATLFFGESTSTSQLIELARDVRTEAAVAARDAVQLPESAQTLEKAARDLRLALREEGGRLPVRAVARRREFVAALDGVSGALERMAAVLEEQGARSDGLGRCSARAQFVAQRMARWRDATPADDQVRWLEIFGHALHLNATPLSVARIFGEQLRAQKRAWIFTSATLSVGGDFSHYTEALGLAEARTSNWDSPFDYPRQALLYVPAAMPEPNTPAYTPAVVDVAVPLIAASGGRAFMLFTSLRAMREAHGLLREAFEKKGLSYPLLLQGEGSRPELLERFRSLGNAVLLGSQSFWEGVDVRGEALSLVLIDKLPFAAPDDPVLAARIDRINQAGGNAFMEYQLPRAVITLKQGAGRLIRDEADRGVLAICDPRLYGKSYGRRILHSLPPMRRTRDAQETVDFLRECPIGAGVSSAAPVAVGR